MTKKLYKVERYKTKEEWLEARAFGGSSASAILGKNPYMTEFDLYMSCTQPKKGKPRDKTNDAMTYGTECEPLMRKMFALDFKDKYKVIAPKGYEMYRRTDKPYLTATIDGILVELIAELHDGMQVVRRGIWECKTHDIRNREDEENWKDGNIPDHHYIQVLHYLMVMNDCDYVEYTAKLRYFDYYHADGKKLLKQEIRYYYIDRTEVLETLKYIEQKETDFYENNVQKRIPPTIKIKF